jgi:hypothetical protein
MPSYSELRCSDADRERVVRFLREQHGVGRLDHDELDERVGQAYAAKTIGDLERLMTDLPRPQMHAAPRPPRAVPYRRRQGPPPALVPLAIAGAVLVGAPMLVGLALGLLVMVGALIFAAAAALAPVILVALLVIGMLRRRRPVHHWHPRY